MLRCGAVLVLLLAVLTGSASGQSVPPTSATYTRTFVQDIFARPLVIVAVTNLDVVACYTIEEQLPPAVGIREVSPGGIWSPNLGVVRWGPFFDTPATNVSYRLAGWSAGVWRALLSFCA